MKELPGTPLTHTGFLSRIQVDLTELYRLIPDDVEWGIDEVEDDVWNMYVKQPGVVHRITGGSTPQEAVDLMAESLRKDPVSDELPRALGVISNNT